MTKTDFAFSVRTFWRCLGGVAAAVAIGGGCSAVMAQSALAQSPMAGAWDAEVEFAPSPEFETDPWRAKTVLVPSATLGSLETGDVEWLNGWQRQASRLGMASSRDDVLPDALGSGFTRIVKTIPMIGQSVRDAIGSPMSWTAQEIPDQIGTGSPRPLARNASFAGASAERTRTVSMLPGGERRRDVASSQSCASDSCFGRDLIKWHTSLSACTKDVRIGVIDTSFDLSHPAFKRLRVVRKEFIDGVAASDEDWHGTAILSLLAGDPESGTPGLVPDATFLLATAFRSDPAGNATTDPDRLLEALNWLDQLDVDIVNMSFAGPPDAKIAAAIERMSLKGVMFVAAAGNMGPTAPPSYPGAYPHVIAVTAINRDGVNYRNANRGTYIDMAAPGVDVLTALPNGKQGLQTGTSFAVPFVTAILATRAASGIVEGTEDLLLERIGARDLGVPGRDPIYGVGLAIAPAQCPGASAVAQAGNGPRATKKAKKRQTTMRAGIADIRW